MANIKQALNIHEVFAINLAFENHILWDAYTPHQFPLFKQKLNELFRNADSQSSDNIKAVERVRDTIYKSTIAQTKYTNKNLLSTFILVTVTQGTTYVQARDATKFSVHLIIRTRKCMKNDDSRNCCMIFIDEHGRVYQNWKAFIENNLLPQGIAYAPSNGTYTYDGGQLSMESWETPATKLSSKFMSATDVASGVGGFTAAGVGLAALAIPVAAPVMAVASGVSIGTGVYSAFRSAWQLKRRRDHEQSNALTDRAARGCWLGVTSGVLAVSSSVANRSIAKVALAGNEVSLIRESVVNGMNISTMLLSGTGVANGILDLLLKFSNDERITKDEWLKMAASLAIFTHSIYNFRFASTIIARSRNSSASSYRMELTSKLREIFIKMSKGNIHALGTPTGRMDLIRLTNEVPDNISEIGNVSTPASISLACQKMLELVEPLVLNRDNFQNCISYLVNHLGEVSALFLMGKAKDLVDVFRRTIEGFIKTTLYYETVLWDLYLKCEEQLVTLTMTTLRDSMSSITKSLLLHYKQMSCRNVTDQILLCKECNGFYQVIPIA